MLFIVREDGKFATLTVYRAEQVAAWTLHETEGLVKSVAVVGDQVYLLIDRGGTFTIELFDRTLHLDSALQGVVDTPTKIWSGLDHLEGETVQIVADGVVQDDQMVVDGQIILSQSASTLQAGLPFTHMIEPLPPSAIDGAGVGRQVRLIEARFRLENTSALRVDVGRGLRDVALKQIGEDEILNAASPQVSGDIRVRAFGWSNDMTRTLWKIEQDLPLPFTLLSVNMELSVND